MPIRGYFVFVGGLLLAIILLIDWYTPQSATEATAASVDRTTIRIHSAHKWPSAVVFDTTQPTIVPPVLAEAAPAKPTPAREALAMAQDSDVAPAAAAAPAAAPAPPKRVRRHTRVARAPSARVASYEPFAFRPFFQSGW
jgi:hypothetical protein